MAALALLWHPLVPLPAPHISCPLCSPAGRPQLLVGRTALVGVAAEQLNERWLQAPMHPGAWEQAAARPLLIPAALLGVAALGWLQGRAAEGAHSLRGGGAGGGGVQRGGRAAGAAGQLDLWAGRAAMVFYLWLLVSQR
jgi:hypothetical protein